MTKKFVNKLIQKTKENEEIFLVKGIESTKDLSQEELHQMNDNILNYSSGRMSEIERTLFEFKLRGDEQLSVKYKRYQASLRRL